MTAVALQMEMKTKDTKAVQYILVEADITAGDMIELNFATQRQR